jgi:hypothetical protein
MVVHEPHQWLEKAQERKSSVGRLVTDETDAEGRLLPA